VKVKKEEVKTPCCGKTVLKEEVCVIAKKVEEKLSELRLCKIKCPVCGEEIGEIDPLFIVCFEDEYSRHIMEKRNGPFIQKTFFYEARCAKCKGKIGCRITVDLLDEIFYSYEVSKFTLQCEENKEDNLTDDEIEF